jgi:TolB-like protein/tetratricopeptide (TPR) repeat protein/DNA-binding winged helix-turn-helix (wHTH) protein
MVENFFIAEWLVRPRRNCIERGDVTVHLAPKAMAVLQCLAGAGGKVAHRQAIFDAVWPGCEVSDDALTQRIVELRKAFGDSARQPAIIETIPKIGFRLIPPVTPAQSAVATTAQGGDPVMRQRRLDWRPFLAPSALTLAIAVAIGYLLFDYAGLGPHSPDGAIEQTRPPAARTSHEPGVRDTARAGSVAVLPFSSNSEQGEDAYLADAMHDELMTRLAGIASLTVISEISAERFRGTTVPLRQIAEELSVATVLTGSVQRENDRLRVSVRLVDAAADEHLWAHSFDRELSAGNIFAVQTEIAERVAGALRASLSSEESTRLAEVPTQNLDAYRALLRGHFAIRDGTVESFRRAIEHYHEALRLNPDFPEAYLAMAGAYSSAVEDRSIPDTEANVRMEEYALKALSLDPNLGQAYRYLGQIRMVERQYKEAETLLRRGLKLTPGNVNTLHLLGLTLRLQGRAEESVPYYDRAVQIDPLSPVINESYGSLLRDLGRFDQSEEQYRKTLRIDPEFAPNYWGLGTLYWSRGDPWGAINWFEQAIEQAPGSDVYHSWLALMYLEVGLDDRARIEIAETRRQVPLEADNDIVLVEELYRLYRGLDDGGLPDGRHFMRRYWYGGLLDLPPRSLLDGSYREAIADYEARQPGLASGEIRVDGSNYRDAIYIAFALVQLGDSAAAKVLLDRAEAALAGFRRLGIHGYWVADAQILAIRGEHERSLERLETALGEDWRNLWRYYLLHDPVIAVLRDQHDFDDLVERVSEGMMATTRRGEDVPLLSANPLSAKPNGSLSQ